MTQNRLQRVYRRLALVVYVMEGELRSMCKTGDMASTLNVFHIWIESSQAKHIFDQFWIFNPL